MEIISHSVHDFNEKYASPAKFRLSINFTTKTTFFCTILNNRYSSVLKDFANEPENQQDDAQKIPIRRIMKKNGTINPNMIGKIAHI